jgi:arsenate reductase (glutaredoxin)
LKLYSYPRCSTCRKAIAWLQGQGIAVDPIAVPSIAVDAMAVGTAGADGEAPSLELIDITLQPPSLQELSHALQQLGRKRLLNTSGQSYRALGAATVQAMDDAALLQALAADGKLIKRPFLIGDDGATLTGFQQAEWESLFG